MKPKKYLFFIGAAILLLALALRPNKSLDPLVIPLNFSDRDPDNDDGLRFLQHKLFFISDPDRSATIRKEQEELLAHYNE